MACHGGQKAKVLEGCKFPQTLVWFLVWSFLIFWRMMCMHLFQHYKKWCFVDVMVSCMECFIYKCLDCRCLLHAACTSSVWTYSALFSTFGFCCAVYLNYASFGVSSVPQPPTIILQSPKDYIFDPRENIVIHCEAKGKPHPRWESPCNA